jgi:ankyrin repeat protein
VRPAGRPPDPEMVEKAYRGDVGYYEDRARGLLASAEDGTVGAVERFDRWGAALTAEGAREVLSRQHGLATWDELCTHVEGLDAREDAFVLAVERIEAHDPPGLREQIERSPSVVADVGTNGNDLLGLAAATCDERLVRELLEHGADPARGNAHGWTALHQAAYSGLPALARMLVDAGAPLAASGRGDGGTPLVVALFWGNRETAELLAEYGTPPRNLRVAAGLGRLDVIGELVPAAGCPAPSAGMHRGFYRPHGGFPAWRPRDAPQEVIDEALAWAARNDRADALDLLAARGASLDADVYRGTALAWAAAKGQLDSLLRLLALGADPDARTTFGGPDHGEGATALHLAAQHSQIDVIRALLDAGADPEIRDARHDGTPAGWADHGGQTAAVELLREYGG